MPLNKEYLILEKTTLRGVRFVLQKDVNTMRASMAAYEAATEAQLPENSENVDVQDFTSGDLSLEVFIPNNGAGVKSGLPIMVHYHGGGLVLKSREWPLIEQMCEMGQFIIVCPSYRLAPEHPWPASLNDSFTAYQWARMNAASLGGNSANMFVSGTSAGGLLAFDVARRVLLDQGLAGSLQGILALVPATVHHNGVPDKYTKTYDRYANDPDRWESTVSIDRHSLSVMWAAARFPSLTDPDIWPLHSVIEGSVKYPPVVFVLAGCDPLYGDGRLMAAALEDAGTPVKALCYPDLFHTL